MKVVTAAEMRQIDQDTIEGVGIPGIVLMETAGSAIVRAIEQHYPTCHRIGIFVGKGNNGGDGLVIARQLAHAGRDAHLFLVSPADSFIGEAEINLQIAKNLGLPIEVSLTDTGFYGTGTVPTTLNLPVEVSLTEYRVLRHRDCAYYLSEL